MPKAHKVQAAAQHTHKPGRAARHQPQAPGRDGVPWLVISHLLGVAERPDELLHGHGLLVCKVVALGVEAAQVDQDVGVSCEGWVEQGWEEGG